MKKAAFIPQLLWLSLLLSAISCPAQSDSSRPGTSTSQPSSTTSQPATSTTLPINNKHVTDLIAKVAQDSGKLIRFKGMLPEYELDRKNADSTAQQSADDNKRAADRLAEDPQSKKLSRKANSAAMVARNDSHKARAAANKLDRLNKDIYKANLKLEKDRQKLDRYRVSQSAAVSQR